MLVSNCPRRPFRLRPLDTLAVWLVLVPLILVMPTTAHALPGGIDGCFFRDLDGSGVQGDAVNPGASGEVAFTQTIEVDLVDRTSGSTVASATTDPTEVRPA